MPRILVGPPSMPSPTFQTQSMPNIGTTSVTPSSPESKSEPNSLQAQPTGPTSSSQIQVSSSSPESGSSHSPARPAMSSNDSAVDSHMTQSHITNATAVEQSLQDEASYDGARTALPRLLPAVTYQQPAQIVEEGNMNIDQSEEQPNGR